MNHDMAWLRLTSEIVLQGISICYFLSKYDYDHEMECS